METSIAKLTERVKEEHTVVQQLLTEVRKVIVGQDYLIDRLRTFW